MVPRTPTHRARSPHRLEHPSNTHASAILRVFMPTQWAPLDESDARALAPAVAARVASPHLDARVVVRRASRASVNMSLVSFVVARGVRAVGQRVGAETRASIAILVVVVAVLVARGASRARRGAREAIGRIRARGVRASRARGGRARSGGRVSVGRMEEGVRGGGEAAKTTSRRRAVVTSGARSFERDGARDRSRVVRGAASDAVEGAPVEKPKKVSNLVKRRQRGVHAERGGGGDLRGWMAVGDRHGGV